jgi:hypothetical protein
MPDIETLDAQAAPSPAIEVPRESAAYAEWRQTGKLPAQPKNEASAASQDHSAAGEKPAEKSAPASEAGKGTQERKPARDNAAARLNELLDDLRRAGFTPAELKTFKREAQQRTDTPAAAPAKEPASEQTANPAEPKEPKAEDFATYEEYKAAERKYYRDLTQFEVNKALKSDRDQRAAEASQQTVRQKMEEAHGRYGDEGVDVISSAARALAGNGKDIPASIPAAVGQMIDGSEVWPDLLFTLGGKAEDLAAFVQLARTDPGGAIRKVVLMERLITEELAKGGKPGAGAGETGRDESGKFVAEKKTPEKKTTSAPPPPREVSGRGTAPPDEIEGAVKNNDFRRFRQSQNSRDVARIRGR